MRDLNVPPRKVFRKQKNKHEFCRIGWLYGKTAEREPALRAMENTANNE